jgi:hypothetical protein
VKRDYSTMIIWAALLVTVTRYSGAFVASDVGEVSGVWSTVLTVFMALSGVGMGFLDVLGLAYVFDGWRRNLPASGAKWSSRFQVLTVFVIGLFVAGLAILTPFTVSRVNAEGMSATLGDGVWWWSLAVNLAPLLLIGGVTFSQSGFVTVRQEPAPVKHHAPTENANARMMGALKTYPCPHCVEVFDSQQAQAAHVRWKHPVNDLQHKNGRAENAIPTKTR